MLRSLRPLLRSLLFALLAASLSGQAPQITQRPLSRIALEGDALSFAVTATGAEPLTYTWRHNGTVLDETTGTLDLDSATVADRGWYHLTVSNAEGQATSVFQLDVGLAESTFVAWGDYAPAVTFGASGPPVSVATSYNSIGLLSLHVDGSVKPWGIAQQGQLDIPETLTNAVQVDLGTRGVAVTATGSVVEWPTAHPISETLQDVVAVATGSQASIALRADGTVVVWRFDYPNPINTPADLHDVVAIATGGGHYLALQVDGTVRAWGENYSGQATVPAGLNNVVAIAAGGSLSGAITSAHELFVWGQNYEGSTEIPAGIGDVIGLDIGSSFSVVQRADGTVVAFGRPYEGQTNVPPFLKQVSRVVAGSTFSGVLIPPTPPSFDVQPESQTVTAGRPLELSIQPAGALPFTYRWYHEGSPLSDGDGIEGATTPHLVVAATSVESAGAYTVELTNASGSVTSNAATVVVAIPPTITSKPLTPRVKAGSAITLTVGATDPGSTSYVWKHRGRAIEGATASTYSINAADWSDGGPYEVIVSNAEASVSTFFHLSITPSDATTTQVVAFGGGDYGQTNVPTDLTNVSSVAAGTHFALALESDGTVRGWGNNNFGTTSVPAGLDNVIAITAGDYSSAALKSDGRVVSWGNYATDRWNIPSTLKPVVAIDAFEQHLVMLHADGTVSALGSEPPAGLTDVVAIAAGRFHGLAVKADGTVVRWGRETATNPLPRPADLGTASGVAAGFEQNIVLRDDGTLVGWGRNESGQASTPPGLDSVAAVEGSFSYSMALRTDGTALLWGGVISSVKDEVAALQNVFQLSAASGFGLALVARSAPALDIAANQVVADAGGTTTLLVQVSGAPGPSLQWYFNDIAIDGATGASLVLTDLQASAAGAYHVVATNTLGTATSAPITLRVETPIVVNARPLSRLLQSGSPASFTFDVSGTGTTTFQWKHDGKLMMDQTTATLEIPAVNLHHRGRYEVVVTDETGTTAHTVFHVQVVASPQTITHWGAFLTHIKIQIPNDLGDAATLLTRFGDHTALLADGTVRTWSTSGRDWTPPLTGVVAIARGSFHQLALLENGTVERWDGSGSYTMPPTGLTDVVAIAAHGDNNVALKADGTVVRWGYDPYGKFNQRPAGLENIVAVAAGAEHVLALRADGVVLGWGNGSAAFVPTAVSPATFIAASDTRSAIGYTNGDLLIWGYSFTLNTHLDDVVQLSFGTPVVALDASGQLTPLGASPTGFDPAVISDIGDAIQVAAESGYGLALRAQIPAVPAITEEPTDLSVAIGETAVFSVTVEGSPTLEFQWLKDGLNAEDGNSSTLTLNHVQESDAGTYQVTVTNAYGAVTSVPVTLNVLTLPVTADQSAVGGSTVTLSVDAATATAYQWRFRGQAITGATAATLTLENLSLADNGAYDVVLTTPDGERQSRAYRLDVTPARTADVFIADADFAPRFETLGGGRITAVLPMPDGSWLVGGDFVKLDNRPFAYLARILANGSLDPDFTPPSFNGPVRALAADANGRIYAGGDFALVDGIQAGGIVRLTTGFTVDETFVVGTGFDGPIFALAVQPDGKVIAGGRFQRYGENYRTNLARLNTDGSYDINLYHSNGFSPVTHLALLPDGKFLAAGGSSRDAGDEVDNGFVLRMTEADGPDYSWGGSGVVNFYYPVRSMAPLSGGRLMVGNGETAWSGSARLDRLDANGTVDESFRFDLSLQVSGRTVDLCHVLPDGRLLVAGLGVPLSILDTEGAFQSRAPELQWAQQNQIVVTPAANGAVRLWGAIGQNSSTRIGSTVLSLNTGSTTAFVGSTPNSEAKVHQVIPVANDRILVRGGFTHVNGEAHAGLVQLTLKGEVDPTFASGASIPTTDTGPLVIEGDGSILVHDGTTLRRLAPDGTLDAAFHTIDFVPGALALAKDGSILIANGAVGGDLDAIVIRKLTLDGSVDPDFAPPFTGNVYDLIPQTTGRILVRGFLTRPGELNYENILRLLPDGTWDDGYYNYSGETNFVVPTPDDRLLYVFDGYMPLRSWLPRGEGDSSFSYSDERRPIAIKLLPDGGFIRATDTSRFLISSTFDQIGRFDHTGYPKREFVVDGLDLRSTQIRGITLLDDGSLWLRGDALSAFGDPRLGLMRLAPALPPAITNGPTSAQADVGAAVTLSVEADGTGSLTYQWYHNQTIIAGATGSTLELSNLTAAHAGSYYVIVTSAYGSATSDPAELTGTNPPPAISNQPESIVVTAGHPATLSVNATGTEPLTYQWRHAGYRIPGATEPTFTLPAAYRADAGFYDVVVADGLSITTSETVRIDVTPTAWPTALDVDPNFHAHLERAGGSLNAIVPTANGKFIVSGEFSRLNGVSAPGIARVDADFKVDPTFTAPSFLGYLPRVGASSLAYTRIMAVLPNGKLLVTHGVVHEDLDSPPPNTLVRLLADGSLDATFNASTDPINIAALAVQPDGRIIVASSTLSRSLPAGKRLVYRLNGDGSLDSAYTPAFTSSAGAPGIAGIVAQADGKAVIGGYFSAVNGVQTYSLVRLDSTGAIDPSFAVSGGGIGQVRSMAADAQGRLWIGGDIGYLDANHYLARLSTNGAIQGVFFPFAGQTVPISSIKFDANGKVWVASGIAKNGEAVWRLSADGVTEQAFPLIDPDPLLAWQPRADGGLWLAPDYNTVAGQVLRGYASDGTALGSVVETLVPGHVDLLAHGPQGTIYAAGNFTHVEGQQSGHLVRLHADGSVDPSFAIGAGFDASPATMTVAPDGGLYLAGGFGLFQGNTVNRAIRLRPDGSLDASFMANAADDATGIETLLTVLSDGRLLFNGEICLFPDGSVDTAFSNSPRTAHSAFATADGGAVMVNLDGWGNPYVSRINAAGTEIAVRFPGRDVNDVATLPDGRVYVAGRDPAVESWRNRPYVERVLSGMQKDDNFAVSGLSDPDTSISTYRGPTLLTQEDGRVILNDLNGMWRLNTDGSRDTSFLQNVVVDTGGTLTIPGATLLLLEDGRLLVADRDMGVHDQRRVGLIALRSTNGVVFEDQPSDQNLVDGDPLNLSATVADSAGLTYQWFKDGLAIDGATSSTLAVDPISSTDAGVYYVAITGPVGTTQSAVARVTVNPTEAPQFSLQPQDQSAASGATITLTAAATGAPTPSLQWQRNGTAIIGATGPTLTLSEITVADSGTYTVVATNRVTAVTSEAARVTVFPIGMTATQTLQSASLTSGSIIVEIANHFSSPESVSRVNWQVLLPAGWSFVSSVDDDDASAQPTAGETSLLEWSWTSGSPNSLDFRYSIEKAGTLGRDNELVTLLTVETAAGSTQYLVQPDPLLLRLQHSADVDGDNRLSLSELLRVIELYNTRSGTSRTGRYRVQSGTADGFAPETTNGSPHPERFHSADFNRDGQLSLSELLRVIELYNTRTGTSRTGRYRFATDSSDGFSPDP